MGRRKQHRPKRANEGGGAGEQEQQEEEEGGGGKAGREISHVHAAVVWQRCPPRGGVKAASSK